MNQPPGGRGGGPPYSPYGTPGYPAQPGYAQPQQPGYAQPQQPGYAQPQQPGYAQPQQPDYAQPQQPDYSQQAGYGAPSQPQAGYGAAPPAGYGAPPQAPSGYGAPPQQQPGYGPAPQPQSGYGPPSQVGYAPQASAAGKSALISTPKKRLGGLGLLAIGFGLMAMNAYFLYSDDKFYVKAMAFTPLLILCGLFQLVFGMPREVTTRKPPTWWRVGMGACAAVGLIVGFGAVFAIGGC